MSDQIHVDRVNMVSRMGDVVAYVDGLDAALADIPSSTDGGAASALLGFIASAGAEAANEYAGAVRLIGAVTEDVMEDMSATESEITEQISNLESGLEED